MDGVSEGTVYLDNVKHDRDLKLKLPSSAREQCTCNAGGQDVVSELMSAFDEALQVNDVKVENIGDSPLGANGGNDTAMTMATGKSRAWEDDQTPLDAPPATSVKSLCKCATFPVTDRNSLTSGDTKDKAHGSQSQGNVSCLRSMSLPVPRKLVSAMKGSREKEGLPLRKLSVSWAPDVYDPPPSSVSHLPKKKSQQYRNNKKHGKGKQKGKNSRGGSKKDKKHHREGGVRTELSLGLKFTMDPVPVADSEKFLSSSYKSTMDILDFDNGVDSPDSNCGSSFLRKSRGSLHFSCAEAT